jgi:surface protein
MWFRGYKAWLLGLVFVVFVGCGGQSDAISLNDTNNTKPSNSDELVSETKIDTEKSDSINTINSSKDELLVSEGSTTENSDDLIDNNEQKSYNDAVHETILTSDDKNDTKISDNEELLVGAKTDIDTEDNKSISTIKSSKNELIAPEGSSENNSSTNDVTANENNQENKNDTVQKNTLTGYIEDDPIPNAVIKITDDSDNVIAEATSDSSGQYSLNVSLIEGEIYTLESSGKLANREITLHSIFKFSSDTVINANPITELKYQLVQSGKSFDEAESLIREYFSIINGKKLEQNRFELNSSTATNMLELSKLYDGTLPIDAIAKIKEDILKNDVLDEKEYAFRTLLQNKLQLSATTKSIEVGKEVSVTLDGAQNLNDSYQIEWLGIPSDYYTDNFTQTFTMNEAGDVNVIVTLYKVDDENSSNKIFVSSESIKINFYQVEAPQPIEITDSDMNITISSDVKVNIPANALSSGTQISYSEVNTNSNDYIKVFNFEPSGTTFATPMEIRVKYNPEVVYDPRKLSIKRISEGGKEDILKVKLIDYANSELVFETEHFSTFIIEDDTDWPWEDTSFEKWDEKGKSGNIVINNLTLKKYSPYHYLVESLDFYCNQSNINKNTCKEWQKYFSNRDNAEKIEKSYKKFFNKSTANGKTNYDVFENDFFVWYLSKKPFDFPGSNPYWGAKESYTQIHQCMTTDSLEGGNRAYTFFSYIDTFTTVVDKINNTIDFLNKLQYDIEENQVLTKVAKVASISSEIYKTSLNNSYKTKTYIVSLALSKFFVGELLGGLNKIQSLGGAYLKVVDLSFKLIDGFKNNLLRKAYESSYRYGKTINMNTYFSILATNFKNMNYANYSIGIDSKNKMKLMMNGSFISSDEALKILDNLTANNKGNNKLTASEFLASFYLTIKNYSKIYENDEYRNELQTAAKLHAAQAALQILEYAKGISVHNSNKLTQAKLKKDNSLENITIVNDFSSFTNNIKINIPQSLWSDINIKKVSLNLKKYSISKEASTGTTKMLFQKGSLIKNQTISQKNISKNGFVLSSQQYTKALASILGNIDNSIYQDHFIVANLTILVNINGRDQVVTKEYEFIPYNAKTSELTYVPEYGKIEGVVKDAITGEALSDVKVVLVPLKILYTDSNGKYSFSKLPPQNYTLSILEEDYQRFDTTVKVQVNKVASKNINLQPTIVKTTPKLDTTPPIITLNKESILNVELYRDYVEAGAYTDDGSKVTISGEVDTSKIGDYMITYNAVDSAGNKAIPKTRTVYVRDTTPPSIVLRGDENITLTVGDSYKDEGAYVSDNGLKFTQTPDKVDTSKVGVYILTYNYSDASGNKAIQKTRTVTVKAKLDTESPIITLNNASTIELFQGDKYYEYGAKAKDNIDGDISSKIVTSGSVDVDSIGTYKRYYTVTDNAGNQASITRYITIIEKPFTRKDLDILIANYTNNPTYTNAQKVINADTSNITDMSNLFKNNETFNLDISSWDVSNVENMYGMFWRSISFNKSLNNWNVSNVKNMDYMFFKANLFNQPLHSWNIENVNTMENFLTYSSFSTQNYDKLLESWSGQNLQKKVIFNIGDTMYSSEYKVYRNVLTDTYSWKITDGGEINLENYSCPGETVKHLNNASSNASSKYTITNVEQPAKYFRFTTLVDGNMTINLETNVDIVGYKKHRLKIGKSCGDSYIYNGISSTNDTTAFPVEEGVVYYVTIQESNSENFLNFNIKFNFWSSL